MSNVFETLNSIDVGQKIEKKGNLSYLSWAWAWKILKSNFPKSTYKVYENTDGMNYHNDGYTCWVKVGVTVEDMEHIEYLPVMDFKNKSISKDSVTSMDVNKAIQRALTKAIGRHGLGLYIYAGEDLPTDEQGQVLKVYKTATKQTPQETKEYKAEFTHICKQMDVDTVEFLTDWIGLDLDKENDVKNAIAKYLKDKDMFAEQLENFKANKAQ